MNIKNLALVGVIISCALLLSACNLFQGGTGAAQTGGQQQTQTQQQNQKQTENQTQQLASPSANGITITASDSGFSPAQATVAAGETITWVNNSKVKIQIASDPHPTHTANTQLTNGDFVMELAPGVSASVTLTKTGTWGIHDHLNPGMRAKIVVE